MNAVDGTLLVEAALKRDRALVLASLALVAVLAWVYVGYLAVGMPGMAVEPSAASLGLTFVMWVVMMVAMMVPTAAPMVLLLITMNHRRHEQRGPLVPTSAFVVGYLIVWSGLAAVATGAQWARRLSFQPRWVMSRRSQAESSCSRREPSSGHASSGVVCTTAARLWASS